MDCLVDTRRFLEIGATLALAVLMTAVPARGSQAYDFGDPTPDEEWMRFLINRARANPEAEADRFGIHNTHHDAKPAGAYDLGEGITLDGLEDQRDYWSRYQGPRQPLAWSAALNASAQNHSHDMHRYNNFDAYTTRSDYGYPRDAGPSDRAVLEGFWTHYVGENIFAGRPAGEFSTADVHEDLFVESDYEERGRRQNMLHSAWREIGVGYYAGEPNAGGWTDFWTIDFGSDALSADLSDPCPEIDTAFVTGVAYDDRNGDGAYQPGEELPGLRVWAWGAGRLLAWHADTADGGGYSIPLVHEDGSDLYEGDPVQMIFFDLANSRYYEAPELAAAAGDVFIEDDDELPVDAYGQQWNLRADALAADFVELLSGDANLDGVVGIADLVALAGGYGRTDRSWLDGDFNFDGVVGIADLVQLAENYGARRQGVPEPGVLVLLGVGAACLRRRR